MDFDYLPLFILNTVGLLVLVGVLYFFRWFWALRGQIVLSPQEVVKLRQELEASMSKREELEGHVERLKAQVDLLTGLLSQSDADRQKDVEVVKNGDSLERAFVSDSPLDVVAAWPMFVKAPPLDLERDFSSFINSGGHWNYHALKGKVPFSRLVKTFRGLVRSGKKIAIFYAACHGNDNGLLLTDGWAEPRKLADLMVLGEVQLVILAACETSRVADAMRRAGVPAIIYMSDQIYDKDAIMLSESIISGLADGLSVEKAVAFAKSEISNKAVAYANLRLTGSHDFNRLTSRR